MTRRNGIGILALGLAASLVAPAAARADCDNGFPKVGYLGISDIECDCTTNFSIQSKDGRASVRRIWTFRSEPRIGEVTASGPSVNRFRPGDVITAIDGALITTRDGSARFSSIEPGQVVKFTVRRENREIPVTVTVGSICPEELTGVFSLGELVAPRAPRGSRVVRVPRAPAPTPETPGTPGVPPTPEVAPAPPSMPRFHWQRRAPESDVDAPVFAPDALPRGWLGVGLSCQDCGGERRDDSETPVWYFGTLPTISFVDPGGPSARAGLRRGDQLTHIDGVPLVSEEGGKRFGAVKPGQQIRWRLIRDGKPTTVAVTAVARPGGEELPQLRSLRERLRALRDANRQLAESREMQDLMRQFGDLESLRDESSRTQKRLRYAGSVGGSDVEVRGLGNVVVDDSGDEVVIITRDATIRIKPGGKVERTPRPKQK